MLFKNFKLFKEVAHFICEALFGLQLSAEKNKRNATQYWDMFSPAVKFMNLSLHLQYSYNKHTNSNLALNC